ncbi:hypothetical protein M436DRAFT_36432 [Aureobasidium namibiae CBS 147.97]|uniref:DUF8004 domain-containing protein n=1 Tax=Aureobasidium namibiae CBS 147.97 TaxID=1043004 RepID=A0A074WWJ3_9PEZI|nr:uncharacterized protein M436DRAFT_36432 [Aureobasidium namibiae CBS 147.97]KEQ77575.1 hypothetical protein M436DRAFT_36432 [Aureobasidium namibiae CBS 147.97]
MGMRLQKTTPTFFQSRSASGQSTLSANTSSSASPKIEKSGFLATPEPQSPLSPNPLSRPSSRLRSESPSSPSYNKVSTAGTLSPVVLEREQKRSRRRSWFGRSKSVESTERGPAAWVMGHPEQQPYNLDRLAGGDRVQDLWDESADCEIHLFARLSGKGSSFRLDSALLASSKLLSELALPSDTGKSLAHTPPLTPKTGSGCRVFLPIALKPDMALSVPSDSQKLSDDEEILVATRNLFAFLAGGSLVATQRNPTIFSVFIKISETLKQLGFSNANGSTFGEIATSSFDQYVSELGLADVRSSPEKTIEGMILGEHMKNIKLYNEAFTHAVGRYNELLKLGSPKFKLISLISTNRLSRAAMDLEKRTASVRHVLVDFDFPQLFSGILNSKTADERKDVDFDVLRSSFLSTRKFVISFYKNRFGSWPPRASKKNELETSGLNRLVCRDLYQDLCAMYDLLVDRSGLTNRSVDGLLSDESAADAPRVRALRTVLSEYDRSSPPVKPPIPYDLPMFPSLRQTRCDGWGDSKKELKAMSKKLKDDDIAEIMTASHNADVPPSSFLNSFREVERKAAKRCTIKELAEIRMGQWLFVYAVLQALPLVTVDGPQLQHTTGVDYFLCESPRFGVPWAREDALRDASRTGIARAGGIVCLPADLFHHGAEGIYFRSHCWQAAKAWSAGDAALASALHSQYHLDVEQLDRPAAPASPSKRSSPAGQVQSRKPVGLGVDSSDDKTQAARRVSAYDPNLTFDSILGSTASGADKKKK